MPNMADPYFAKTLTYICEHNDQGALGLVVNRPIDMTLQALFERLSLKLRRRRAPRRADLLRRAGADRPRLRAARAGGQLAVDAARARRHRPHHLEGHPRGGGPRRRPGAHAGDARLRRLVAGAARARAVAERLAHGGSAATASSSRRRPKSACRRRWSCSAWTSRGCRTKRDMPERRARTILAFDFGLKRIGVAVGEPELRTRASVAGGFRLSRRSRSWWRNGSRRIAGGRLADVRAAASRTR